LTSIDSDAKVRIVSKIITDGEAIHTDMTADAHFYKQDHMYILEYDNKEQACRTKVTVDATSVAVTHSGSVETTMVFKNNYIYKSNYGVEYGDLEMEIRTDRIFVDLNSEGGSIELWYELWLGGCNSDAKMIMEITKD